MRFRRSKTTDRAKDLGHGTPHRQIAPLRGTFRRPRFRPGIEHLDVRALLSTVTLTGNVFLQQDVSGNYTFPEAVAGNFVGPIEGVTVTLSTSRLRPRLLATVVTLSTTSPPAPTPSTITPPAATNTTAERCGIQ